MPKITDRKGKQLLQLQEVEKEKSRYNYLLLHYKFSPEEKALIKLFISNCDRKIDEINRKFLIDKGDILSCHSMKF